MVDNQTCQCYTCPNSRKALTKQVRLQYWLDVIRQCRAFGLKNQAWCEQNQISLKSYYYWIAQNGKHLFTVTVKSTTLLPSSGRYYIKFSKVECNYNSLIVSVIAML